MSLNIMEAFEAKPQPIDYVLPNLAIGTIGAIVSPGGVGKSMLRSEERRVGKECRSRWSPYH